MAINVIHYLHGGKAHWGILHKKGIVPLPGYCTTTADFIAIWPAGKLNQHLESAAGPELTLEEVQLCSPVTANQQFLCQGANYRQHMIESGMNPDAKTFNMFFTKAPGCISPADCTVIRPGHVRFLDYEVELGLVIRQNIHKHLKVTASNLADFVYGLVIVNDYSARDVQIPQMQFYKGKSYRTFGPVGPNLCVLEQGDYGLLRALKLRLEVNGQVRQADTTANLVFGPEETLTEWSGVHDLNCGDLIATGTPAGCALAIPSPAKQRLASFLPEAVKWKIFLKTQAKRPHYLKPGDVVTASIQSECGRIDLGMQRNLIAQQQA